MGFDLYGLNPKTQKQKPKRPDGMYEDGVPQPSRETIDEYFNKLGDYQNESGTYFRNNVWWWRPLASYIINETGCIEEKDYEEWHSNGGHQVSEQLANAIADQLEHLISSGHTKKFEEDHMKELQEAEEHNKLVEAELDQFVQSVQRKMNDTSLVPRDFPKEDHEQWNKIYAKQKMIASYPFSVQNVKEFIEFCRNSGGFEIC